MRTTLIVVTLLVLSVGALMYRGSLEKPETYTPETACTLEAKLCPDGTSVGRTEPGCAFAACPFPNVEIPEYQLSFVVPAGYTADENAYGADTSLLAAFVKPSLSGNPQHTITIRRYQIPEGKTGDQVVLEATRYQPADMPAENFERFTNVTLGTKTFRTTGIERFEALVQSSYFLVRAHDVIRFDVTEHDVTSWMDTDLVVSTLPEHKALEGVLRTLQVGE